MDSTRSGPLSTLILLLPLIVVPAVALLRPAERDTGLVSSDLTASEGGLLSGMDDFEAIFGIDESGTDQRPVDADDSDDAHPKANLFDRRPPGEDSRPARQQPTRSAADSQTDHRTEERVQPDLSHLGVTSSLWFQPGSDGRVGFIAFVPSGTDRVRYRFSSIRATDTDAVADVSKQIRLWREAQQTPTADQGP